MGIWLPKLEAESGLPGATELDPGDPGESEDLCPEEREFVDPECTEGEL
jgi:hypothetical protein